MHNFFTQLLALIIALVALGGGIYLVIGGFVGLLLYARHAKLQPFWDYADMAAIGLPLGHAIGRWGNYVNQELYGTPTSLPWALSIDNPPTEYADASGFHPLFLYESLWNLLLCGFLLWLWLRHRDRLKPGDMVLIYLIGYNTVRFLLEFLRIETAHIAVIGLNSSQTTSAIAVIVATAVLVYRHRNASPAQSKFHPDGARSESPKAEQA
ncbi:MAG: prolipoprotein diacylglyceryl transferase [Anaerolineae bacterium]|nr:prolipoprotein diacylglyceryl transferase [Anaerolineae bacterium]